MSWRFCVLNNGFNSARAAKVGCASRHAAISSLSLFSMCPGQANLKSVSRARCEAGLRERLFRTVLRQLSSSAKPPRGQADARDDKDEGHGAGDGGEQGAPAAPQKIKMMVGIALCAGVLGAFLNIRHYERQRRREAEHVGGAEGQVKVLKGPAVGKPELGGGYTLINQNGKVMGNTDLFGSWALLYFGFTYCPDICPNELTRLQEILSILDAEAADARIQPVFITIDPERDGPAQLKTYLEDWNPRLVGLTGTPAQIEEVCKKFRVYASKAVLGDDPKDYLIDHSVMFYLIDPKGEFVDYYGQNLTSGEIAKRIVASIRVFHQ